jgi:hypothetical protein
LNPGSIPQVKTVYLIVKFSTDRQVNVREKKEYQYKNEKQADCDFIDRPFHEMRVKRNFGD